MGQIQQLYAVEAALRQQRAGPRLRAAQRAHQSKPVVQRLERAMVRLKASRRHLPQSLLGQAMDYALGQWPTLTVYLENGRLEIDNNIAHAARGMSRIMPLPILCRVGSLEPSCSFENGTIR